mmetsp:Transcript_12785/g.36485  ORF Transcript_12785/g.36485 Transcript_12785/m.36485 type:complete len:394 (+) Transcript_12785:51-1232(+)
MKFPAASYTIFLGLISQAPSNVSANDTKASPAPPKTCISSKLSPATDQDTLLRDQAICRGDGVVRLGVNTDGTYGVWNGDDIVQTFATNVYKMKLRESVESGEKVDLTAYKSKGEHDSNVAWKLECHGLSGQGETKLTVHDDNNTIVRLKQGHETQDALWLVHNDGKIKLDDTEGRQCQITEHHGTSDESEGASSVTKKPSNEAQMIVLSSNRHLCMSTIRPHGIREGDRIAISACNADDEAEQFKFDERGRIRPRRAPDLCVHAEEATVGQTLALADCHTANHHIFLYNSSGKGELTPRGGKSHNMCVGSSGLIGASLTLEKCNSPASWEFVSDYEAESGAADAAWELVNAASSEKSSDNEADAEDIKYETSRKFLRWRKLVDTAIDMEEEE